MALERPLTAAENSLLKGYTKKTLYWHILKAAMFGWAVFSLLAFALLFTIWKWIGPSIGFETAPQHRLECFLLSVALVGVYLVKSIWPTMMSQRNPGKPDDRSDFYAALERDRKGGLARTETFHVTEAVEIAEYEDEGVGFFLVLEDGRVLCVIGQDLYDYAHDAETEEAAPSPSQVFPSTMVEYTFAPASGLRLDLKGVGTFLKISGIAENNRSARQKARHGIGPEDGTFYDGPLSHVLKKFSLTLVKSEAD